MSVDINAVIAQMFEDTTDAYRLTCALTSSECVDETPVLSGSLQASWTPNAGPPKPENIDTRGENSKRHDISGVINELELDDEYSLSNAQPYALITEFENHSAKGDLMLTKATERFSAFADQAMKKHMK